MVVVGTCRFVEGQSCPGRCYWRKLKSGCAKTLVPTPTTADRMTFSRGQVIVQEICIIYCSVHVNAVIIPPIPYVR